MRRTGERVEFYKGQDGKWRWRRVAANNEIVATGEGYENRSDAMSIVEKDFRDVAWFAPAYDDSNDWIEVTHGF